MAITMNTSKVISTFKGEAPGHCTNLVATDLGAGRYGFKWTDPVEGIWGGTKLVIKKDSAPKNEKDGVIIENSIVKNQYNENNIEVTFDESLESGTYYAALFPYSPLGSVNSILSSITDFQYRKAVTFESCTMDELQEMVADESAYTAFNVGDIKTIELNDGTQTQLRIGRIDNTDTLKRIFIEMINCPFSAGAKTVVNIAAKYAREQLPAALSNMAKTINHLNIPGGDSTSSVVFYLPTTMDYYLVNSSHITNNLDTRLTYYQNVSDADRSLLIKKDIGGNAIKYGSANEVNVINCAISKTGEVISSVSCPINIPIVFVI